MSKQCPTRLRKFQSPKYSSSFVGPRLIHIQPSSRTIWQFVAGEAFGSPKNLASRVIQSRKNSRNKQYYYEFLPEAF